jgi:hypothetical protein
MGCANNKEAVVTAASAMAADPKDQKSGRKARPGAANNSNA